LTAILLDEPDAGALVARLQRTKRRVTSPLAVWETAVALARGLGLGVREAGEAVEAYLTVAEITLVAVPPEAGSIALGAFDRFGKGRHPARLNFGDCFSYACARHYRLPLLFEGADFPLTDIEAG
jgi:ribonuclease VapC